MLVVVFGLALAWSRFGTIVVGLCHRAAMVASKLHQVSLFSLFSLSALLSPSSPLGSSYWLT
jgi:hypothetical protein